MNLQIHIFLKLKVKTCARREKILNFALFSLKHTIFVVKALLELIQPFLALFLLGFKNYKKRRTFRVVFERLTALEVLD